MSDRTACRSYATVLGAAPLLLTCLYTPEKELLPLSPTDIPSLCVCARVCVYVTVPVFATVCVFVNVCVLMCLWTTRSFLELLVALWELEFHYEEIHRFFRYLGFFFTQWFMIH